MAYGLQGHLLSTVDQVSVSFTGTNDYTLTIQAPLETYGNDTEGLCGNMNGNPNDDPACPDGESTDICWERRLRTTTILPISTTAVSQHTTTNYNPECDPDYQKIVNQECSIITQINGPFAICVTNASDIAKQYYSSCIYDLCASSTNDTAPLCAILQSYADACMQEIPTATLKWRSENLCRKFLL